MVAQTPKPELFLKHGLAREENDVLSLGFANSLIMRFDRISGAAGRHSQKGRFRIGLPARLRRDPRSRGNGFGKEAVKGLTQRAEEEEEKKNTGTTIRGLVSMTNGPGRSGTDR